MSSCHPISLCLLCGQQAFLFFAALKNKYRFEWTKKREEAFSKRKTFITSSPILTLLREGSPLLLYLSVTNEAMSSVPV